MAQYESEARSPKQDLINQLAQIFHVDSRALTVPDIDTYVGLMHTPFCPGRYVRLEDQRY